uniref:helix-turn-helix domain-containing protein n=1 Tax=Aminipila terrae TaxID=2697030 RepID=UPI001FAD6F42|nr:helix-turn-helix domain-containing protein [Aminipila terrae]
MNYDWPGNIRELRNAIEYAFNFISGTTITLNDIPELILYSNKHLTKEPGDIMINSGHFDLPLAQMVEEYEKEIIRNALKTGGNVTNAARLLGTSRQALQYKIMKYHLN